METSIALDFANNTFCCLFYFQLGIFLRKEYKIHFNFFSQQILKMLFTLFWVKLFREELTIRWVIFFYKYLKIPLYLLPDLNLDRAENIQLIITFL